MSVLATQEGSLRGFSGDEAAQYVTGRDPASTHAQRQPGSLPGEQHGCRAISSGGLK